MSELKILDFIPALEWGNIAGTITEQTDLMETISGSGGKQSGDIDGGVAHSIYTPEQFINCGGA
jgi:hypothetical protein